MKLIKKNAEEVNSIIKKMPFYLPIIGELSNMPKYEVEELISFCNLTSVIIKDTDFCEKISAFKINYTEQTNWNVIIKTENDYQTAYYPLDELSKLNQEALIILNIKQLKSMWPYLVNNWSSIV
ncbi:hypothetical protein SAMN00017405_0201 [Desulfonispora thiosulfatigenes DSM 11270]|uniref:Uncharacterized protein n=1 Tax=Desulfonispora thiosulfatigenes DSM 11270 TaxID=656914 RepID=A0A1W1VM67_DESTI|nr:hypothetical protein [Desulfonispora thiosulfatigenes]SMB94416.1 hypothetical protein SAMN00017405_0201 [Desulfonispora thiosulfatigenes DSM 11270]